jgi:hypothetical protein
MPLDPLINKIEELNDLKRSDFRKEGIKYKIFGGS